MRLNKDFFLDNEVLFVGYSSEGSKNAPFSKSVYQAFRKNGLKVVPYNNKASGSYDQKVYHDISEIDSIPKTAYFLVSRSHAGDTVEKLAGSGVKRVLFQNKNNVDPQTLDRCKSLGMEAVVACPMMIFGSGLHRFHAFLAGVKR